MSKYPLSIAGLGMISSLGEGSEVNAAAMRCNYDGFQETLFNQPYYAKKQLGAPVESELSGVNKLSYMSMVAVKEAINKLPKAYPGLNVIYCLPEQSPITFFNIEDALRDIIKTTFKEAELGQLGSSRSVFWQQRCGFVSALKKAQELLYQHDNEYVLIVSIDSLLNNASLTEYGGGIYGENRRLLASSSMKAVEFD